MPGRFMKWMIVLTGMIFLAGCSQAPRVSVKSYIKDQKRVDQKLSGNAGYLTGTPKVDDQNRKMTRKVFVVEVTQETPEVTEKRLMLEAEESLEAESSHMGEKPVYNSSYKSSIRETKARSYSTPDISIPKINYDELEVEGEIQSGSNGKFIEYTVTKDDTLQKISKKFYNANSKWTKIYEANKSVIKNPDFIVPGTVIRIPVE